MSNVESGEHYTWRLWCSYTAALLGLSFSVGTNGACLNLIENYVNCWLYYADIASADSPHDQATAYHDVCQNASGLAKTGQLDAYRMKWSLLTSAVFIGGIVGNALALLADFIGRQKMMLACLMVQVVSTLIQLFAISQFKFWMFAVGRTIGGISFGAAPVIVPMYTMEITPLQHQASIGTLHPLGYNIGGLIILVLASEWALGKVDLWVYLIAVSGAPGLVGLLLYPWTVESPSYLMKVGKTEKSQKAQILLHRTITVTKDELPESHRKGYTSAIFQLFNRSDYRHLLAIVTVIRTLAIAGGVYMIMIYTLGIAQSVNLGPAEASIITISNQVLNCVAGFMAPVVVSRFGLKRAFQASFLAMTVAVMGAFILGFYADSSYYAAVAMCAMLVIYSVSGMVGVTPIGYMVTVLWIPTELRGFVVSALSVFGMSLMFVAVLLFPSSLAYLGHYTYLVMSAVTIVGGGISSWYIFDSAGMTPEEILGYLTKKK